MFLLLLILTLRKTLSTSGGLVIKILKIRLTLFVQLLCQKMLNSQVRCVFDNVWIKEIPFSPLWYRCHYCFIWTICRGPLNHQNFILLARQKTFPIFSFSNFLKMAFYLPPPPTPPPKNLPMVWILWWNKGQRTPCAVCMCENRNRLSGSLIGRWLWTSALIGPKARTIFQEQLIDSCNS